jgi:hypothetical protein
MDQSDRAKLPSVIPAGGAGGGSGLGDIGGGPRRATAEDMTGSHSHVGDAPVEIPAADPGAARELASPPPAPSINAGDPAQTGLGDAPAGSSLKEFDAAFRRTENDNQ